MTRAESWKRNAPTRVDASHTCRCGKQVYRSRKEARLAQRRRHPSEKMRAYVCTLSTGPQPTWHLGHIRRQP